MIRSCLALALRFTLTLAPLFVTSVGAQATATAPPTTAPTATSSWSLIGRWRVQRGTVAPWVKDKGYHPDARAWVGKTIRFDAQRVTGVDPLDCVKAHYEATRMPADGLFMGGLLAPAKPAALALGFKAFPVPGTSFTCDKGLFEFHYADANAVLVAVNNVIWTLDRSPGALADTGTPSAVVQQFLERHFAGDMGFDAKQEDATRFSVGMPVAAGALMLVPVRYSDAYRTRQVRFVLERQGPAWRITDVRAGRGEPTLWELLK
jgi:hypothetical protein